MLHVNIVHKINIHKCHVLLMEELCFQLIVLYVTVNFLLKEVITEFIKKHCNEIKILEKTIGIKTF